jgi:DNA-binding MarR family transcriptional regulator
MTPFEDNFFQQLAFACAETRQSFADFVGMNQTRMQLLTGVAEAGEISHAALQQQLAQDGATITRLVKQFEAEGILSRRLDPQDNRYTLVSLTESGQQIVAGLRAAHGDFETRLLQGIPKDDQETFVRVLEQLRANIQAVRSENSSEA